jgi:3-deoxy-manno-octulosonate cytidylyltransferase (CMP-KDO synthetase)
MKIIAIIPSRYASSRFPGKPLIDVGGKTMIRRVYEQACKCRSLNEVIVATDDERIFQEVKTFGGNVVMTLPSHHNGTERCAEVAANLDADVIINVQGDEPFIQPEQIDLLASVFKHDLTGTQIATLVKEHPLNEELQNPARVKVVLNKNNRALYFSRSVIPFVSGHERFAVQGFLSHGPAVTTLPIAIGIASPENLASLPVFYKHLGIYGYRKDVLMEIVKLSPSPLELAEKLEQLRWLENGYTIQCAVTTLDSVSVDTPADLETLMRNHPN